MNELGRVILIIGLVYLSYKLIDTNRLLKELSDDINQIKEKLGLPTEARTSTQIYERDYQYICRSILDGKTKKELSEILGFWRNFKYRGEIAIALEDYPNRRICPDCRGLWNSRSDKCYICGIKTIPFKEYQKEHPDEKGNVDGYV
jgi:hypothetical protein